MTEPPVLEPNEIPQFARGDPERWALCVGVARQIAGWDDPMLAALMFKDSRIPTHPVEQVQEAWSDKAREAAAAARRRNAALRREGHDLKPMAEAPKPQLTAAEMVARGFDEWPAKGPMAREVLGDVYDTQVLHRPEGDLSDRPAEERYTEERQRTVHDPIVDALVADHASQAEPHVLVVAGGPASGKTTFLRKSGIALPDDAVHLNADDIAAGDGPHEGIPEARDMLDAKDPYAAVGAHREAGDIFEKAEQAAVAKRANIVMDVTGNGDTEQFERQLRRLHEAGYKVDMLYVSTPTERASRQNLYRAEQEGRYVPTPVLRDKHRRVAENFKVVSQRPYVSSVRVYDPEHGLVGFRNKDGGMEQTHEEGYARWMAKADEPRVELPEPGRSLEEARLRHPVIAVPFELEDREAAHAAADAAAAEQARKAGH